jgi:hypothetical protein
MGFMKEPMVFMKELMGFMKEPMVFMNELMGLGFRV